MAVSKAESIFLGHTPADQRKYIAGTLKHLREKFPVIHLPAVGQFTLARAAIEAGYERENIFTSDVSLFSSILGNLFAGRKALEFGDGMLELSEALQAEVDAKETENEKAVVIFWYMKWCQMAKIHYMKAQLEDLVIRRDAHEARMLKQLEEMRKYFDGINYEIRDLRDYTDGTIQYSDQELVLVNPPVFAGGYTKMFDFGEYIQFDPQIAEFHFGKEYRTVYDQSHELNAPFIWYRSRDVTGFPPREVIYAKEYKVGKVDYWLCTQPEILDDFEHAGAIKSFGRKQFIPYKASGKPVPTFGETDEITYDSKISFVSVKEEVALYYRDLWAHKLGNTKGEQYYLMLVDGKVFATMAMMLGPLFRMQTDYVFENYGFNAPSVRYKRLNRLLMWAITSEAFGDVVRSTTASVNRYWQVIGLRTTCLSKYRKVKLNNGILAVEKRERMPNGMYKIMYHTDFRDETFADVVKRFLDEEKLLEEQS